MSNKNIKIILAGIIILLLIVVLIFLFKYLQENKVIGVKSAENLLQDFKKNHPEYSAEQLKFYSETAAQKKMTPCLGRSDEGGCIFAVAFITNNYNFCGEIKDEKAKLECSGAVLANTAADEIAKCHTLTNDAFKTQCLVNLFNAYKQPQDCANLKKNDTRTMCESAVYYQQAIMQRNAKLCDNIQDDFLKTYCLENAAG